MYMIKLFIVIQFFATNIIYGFIPSKYILPQFFREKRPSILSRKACDVQMTASTNWYVIGEKHRFQPNTLYKKTIWNRDYVVWKKDGQYFAMDNHCSHRGAALSNGRLVDNNVACPYHGYEFNSQGILSKVPGLSFKNSPCQNLRSYQIREQNGWVYVNTNATLDQPPVPIFAEPEATDPKCAANFLNLPFNAYARLISENSLDVMHIAYVHTFGNVQVPSPIYENPPKLCDDYPGHYKTQYVYLSGENSIAKKMFNSSILNVDVEFVLPHLQLVRVRFDKYVSTIITSITPINMTHSHVYMKTYRSYWYIPNASNIVDQAFNTIFHRFTEQVMWDTILQDKFVVENIKPEHMDGKYNMKFDKPGNVYRQLYKKLVHD